MADEEEVIDSEGGQKEDEVIDEVLIEAFNEEPSEGEKKDQEGDGEGEEKDNESAVKLKEMESELSRLRQDKVNLNKALHEERQAKKGEKAADEVKLGDAEITKLLEEYKDDPTTLKNIIRYIAKEEARGAKKEGLIEADIVSKKKEVDTFLNSDLPELGKDGSELRGVVDNIKTHFGIQDHPFGDLFAVGAHMAMNRKALLQGAFDAGKKAALGDKGEAARKEAIKGNELLKGGKRVPGTGELTAGQKETAKRLGISERRPGESNEAYNHRMQVFKNIVSKPGAAVTVEA